MSDCGSQAREDYENALAGSVYYSLGQYIVPLAYIFVIMLALYAMTHPAILGLGRYNPFYRSGVWRGGL